MMSTTARQWLENRRGMDLYVRTKYDPLVCYEGYLTSALVMASSSNVDPMLLQESFPNNKNPAQTERSEEE